MILIILPEVKSIDDNIDFLIRINDFNSNRINKILYDITHDGILTMEECKEYADTKRM